MINEDHSGPAGQPGRAAQVVVVTGSSGGIGRATALAFAARGAKVALLARGEEGLAGAVRDVEARGGTALAIPTDVSDPDQVEAAAEKAEQELGPIDVWVNVAFTSVFAEFKNIEPAEYKRVTEVSYLGYVYGTMAALKRMQARDAGTIVQVGSTLAYRGIPLQTAYCGAKHAIQGFHESLRCELLHDKSNVHVTMVQMPAVNTPQFDWVLSRLPKPAQPVPPIYQPESRRPRRALRRRSPQAPGVLGRRDHDGNADRQRDRARPARPLPGQDRLQVPGGRPARVPGPPGQPVGARRRAARPRLHRPRQLRRQGQVPQRPAVGLPAPRRARRGAARPGRRGRGRHRARAKGPPVTLRAETVLASLRAGYGAVQLAVPGYSAEQQLGGPLDPATLRVVRVLGARQLVQAGLAQFWLARSFPAEPLLGLGVGVDALHALSMVPVVAAAPRWRRPALVSGLTAAAFAVAGALAARRIPGNQTFN